MGKLGLKKRVKKLKFITILGRKVNLIKADTLLDDEGNSLNNDGGMSYGEMNHRIEYTQENLDDLDADFERMFFHEFGHAVIQETQLRNLEIPHPIQEVIADTIGMAIQDLLKDLFNKK